MRADNRGKDGYHRVSFRLDGGSTTVYAHRVIWVYHNGPIPDGKEVNHKDRNKSNNLIGNLELVTRLGNMQHAGANGAWDGKPVPTPKRRETRDVGGVLHYQCTGCNGWKPKDGFAPLSPALLRQSECGIRPQCRVCYRAADAASKRKRRASAGGSSP